MLRLSRIPAPTLRQDREFPFKDDTRSPNSCAVRIFVILRIPSVHPEKDCLHLLNIAVRMTMEPT